MTDQPIGAYIPGAVKKKCTRCKRKYYAYEGSLECKPCATEARDWFNTLSPEQQQDVLTDAENFMCGFLLEIGK